MLLFVPPLDANRSSMLAVVCVHPVAQGARVAMDSTQAVMSIRVFPARVKLPVCEVYHTFTLC